MKSTHWLIIFTVLLTTTLLGCNKNHTLKGKVTYEDGTPITVGFVNFASETSMSRAKIQSDGSYTAGTLKETDGIPKGTYKVYITGAEKPLENNKSQNKRVDSMGNPIQSMVGFMKLVGLEYMTASSTPITCKVPVEKNRFDIIVKKPPYIK